MKIYYFYYEVDSYSEKFVCQHKDKLEKRRKKLLNKKNPIIKIGDIQEIDIDKVISV